MNILTLLSILLGLSYLLFHLTMIKGIRNTRKRHHSTKLDPIKGISLIVPFRNELERIADLIHFLNGVQTTNYMLEVLFVDDHSTDQTATWIEEQLHNSKLNYTVLSLKEQEGKKAALQHGVKQAKYDIIACTDADCKPDVLWLDNIANRFANSEIDFIIGAVELQESKGYFTKIWKQEWKALQALTAGSAGIKRPVLCNGANISFKRSLFLKENPFEKNSNYASGDDIFLLQAFKNAGLNIGYANVSKGNVKTSNLNSGLEILKQKVRWAQKTIAYKDIDTLLLGTLISSVNLFLFSTYFLAFFGLISVQHFLILFFSKCLMDFPLLLYFKKEHFLIELINTLFLSFFYPIYTVLIALLSLIWKPNWKGRKTIK